MENGRRNDGVWRDNGSCIKLGYGGRMEVDGCGMEGAWKVDGWGMEGGWSGWIEYRGKIDGGLMEYRWKMDGLVCHPFTFHSPTVPLPSSIRLCTPSIYFQFSLHALSTHITCPIYPPSIPPPYSIHTPSILPS